MLLTPSSTVTIFARSAKSRYCVHKRHCRTEMADRTMLPYHEEWIQIQTGLRSYRCQDQGPFLNMLFVTGAVQILCKKITRQLFLRTDLPDLAKYGGAGAYRRRLCSELYKDRFDRWFTRKLRISNGLWLHPKGYHKKNHYFFSEKEETGKVTQKKILLKSMRALEFQCPLKFRCQTRDILMTDASVLSNSNIALQNSETVLRKFKKILYRGGCVQSTGRGVGFNVQEILVTLGRKLCVFNKF